MRIWTESMKQKSTKEYIRKYGIDNVRGGVYCAIDRRYNLTGDIIVQQKPEKVEINWSKAREILHRPKGTPEELKALYKNLFTV